MQTGPSDTFIAHKAISLSDDLTGTEKRVAATIIDHFNRKTGQCDPALGSIARLLGIHRRTVIRAVGALVRKGYLGKSRHGGNYHRNSYQPQWSRFHAQEAKWKDLRTPTSRRAKAADLSPSKQQICHLDGDADVSQTCSKNSLKETLVAARPETKTRTSKDWIGSEGLSKVANRNVAHRIAEERFHVKAPSSRIAARDAAERRWNDLLTKQFAAAPDVFASLIDAIDPDLQCATTDVELRKPGSGIAFLLRELDRRSPLRTNARLDRPDTSTGPPGGFDAAGSPTAKDL